MIYRQIFFDFRLLYNLLFFSCRYLINKKIYNSENVSTDKVGSFELRILAQTQDLQILKKFNMSESERSFPQHCILSSTTLHSRSLPLIDQIVIESHSVLGQWPNGWISVISEPSKRFAKYFLPKMIPLVILIYLFIYLFLYLSNKYIYSSLYVSIFLYLSNKYIYSSLYVSIFLYIYLTNYTSHSYLSVHISIFIPIQ